MDALKKTAGSPTEAQEADAIAEDELAARRLLYAVFQALFGSEPNAPQMNCLDADLVRRAAQLVDARFPPEFFSQLAAASGNLDELKSHYTRLFVGPGKLPSPPWESAHRGTGGALFQPSTLEVRNAYRTHGFLPHDYPRVADDHIALEADYLGALAQRIADAHDAEDDEALRESVRASLEFLRTHVLKWIDSFASGLRTQGENDFYATAAEALASFARTDAALLERMVDR